VIPGIVICEFAISDRAIAAIYSLFVMPEAARSFSRLTTAELGAGVFDPDRHNRRLGTMR
jgi:hypothetical protein